MIRIIRDSLGSYENNEEQAKYILALIEEAGMRPYDENKLIQMWDPEE